MQRCLQDQLTGKGRPANARPSGLREPRSEMLLDPRPASDGNLGIVVLGEFRAARVFD